MSHVETIKRVMSGSYENATPEERALAVKVVQACAVAAAALTIQPFPFVDIALITPIQVAMVQGIGKIYNQSLDQKSVLEILTSIGASLVAQQATIAAAKFVPGLGWIVAMSMAYAMTWAIGEVSEHWFRTGRGASSAASATCTRTCTRRRRPSASRPRRATTRSSRSSSSSRKPAPPS